MVAQPLELLALLGLTLPAQGPTGLPQGSDAETQANGGFANLLAKTELTENTAIIPPGKGQTGEISVEAAFETGSKNLPIDANPPKMAASGGAGAIYENSLSMPFMGTSAQPYVEFTETPLVVAPQPAEPELANLTTGQLATPILTTDGQVVLSAEETLQPISVIVPEIDSPDGVEISPEGTSEDAALRPLAETSAPALVEEPTELVLASLGQPNLSTQSAVQQAPAPRPNLERQAASPLSQAPTTGPIAPNDAAGQDAARPFLQAEPMALRNFDDQAGREKIPTEQPRLMPGSNLEPEIQDRASPRPARPSLAAVLGEQLKSVSAPPSSPPAPPPVSLSEGSRSLEFATPNPTVPTTPSGPVTGGQPLLTQAGLIAGEAQFTGAGKALRSEPAEQLAVQVQRQALAGRTRFNVQLEPAELGRVEVKLDFGRDGGVKAVIAVERAETFELLQRDGQSLERALRDAGFSSERMSLHYDLQNENRGQQDKQAGGDPSKDLNEDSDNGLRDEEEQPASAMAASEDAPIARQLDRLIDVSV